LGAPAGGERGVMGKRYNYLYNYSSPIFAEITITAKRLADRSVLATDKEQMSAAAWVKRRRFEEII
jgi:hypothetical protein